MAVRRRGAGARPRAAARGGLPATSARAPATVSRRVRPAARLGPVPLPAPRAARRHPRRRVHARCSARAVRSPFAIAPTTLQRAAHPDGEVAMARGPRAGGSLVVVSSNAGTPFGDIGTVGAPWWLQLYVTADRSVTVPVVESAVEAGARALVLTADTPVVAHQVRRRADRLGRDRPGAGSASNFPERRGTAGRGGEGDRPRPARHRLARRPVRAAGRRQGRPAPGRRPPLRRRRRRRGVGLQPRRPAARPGGRHRGGARRGRRRRSPERPRSTSTGEYAGASDALVAAALGARARLPRPATALRARGRRRGRRHPAARRARRRSCEEALRLAGCTSSARPGSRTDLPVPR